MSYLRYVCVSAYCGLQHILCCVFCFVFLRHSTKSLKIPKGQSESVYRRRTDNTMAKRKSTKGQITIYNTYI
jgi:hypothetical protein